ncbi:MAG TPA: hypothetical protein VFL04_02975, partial [Rectinemataceae bacterium]|nr:hypothetical protein [Rectinemataceae bacterium]
MRGRGPSGPTASTWADALLTTDAEALLGAVRNYLGPVKTPYDKRDLVKRLESFLRRPDTAESLILLLDRLDARIIGSCLLLGPSSETAVKELFAGELALFELGVRLSNLLDRLLLFRYVADGKRLIAVNPLLEASLRLTVLDPLLLFGASDRPALGVPERQAACDAPTCVAFFSFLFHTPGALRKGGGLTKRATERVLPLFAGMGAGTAERAAALARALYASGAIRHEESEWAADRNAFGSMLAQWGPDLPFFLAAALSDLDSHGEDEEREGSLAAAGTGARGRIEGLARLLAEALGSPHVADMSRAGLSRWLRICSRRADHQGDPSLAMPALEALGLLGLAVAAKARPMAEAGPPAASEPSASEPRLPEAAGSAEPRVRLVAEGA